jgi:hypothetical protein
MAAAEPNHNYAADIADLLASLTDNGRSLRSFINHPQELGICILTAGLLANSKLSLRPEDAIKSSFEIYASIQGHVSNYQNMKFAATVNDVFNPHLEWGNRPPEVDQD